MFLAPTAQLSGRVVPLAGGRAGVDQTLRQMRELVNAYRTDLDIRQTAVSVMFLTPPKNEVAEIEALHDFVRDTIRYVRDIHDVETIATPEKTLEMRYGDCDDKSVLLATMLESIGYPTRFVVAGYSIPGALEHVYLQVFAKGEWIDSDPTEPGPFGKVPPDPVTIFIEEI